MASTSRQDRDFWERTIVDFERSGATHAVFAQRAGVTLGALRHWLYKLRRERSPRGAGTSVRLVPIEITNTSAPDLLEIGIGAAIVRFRAGTDPAYIARLVAQLREPA